MGNQSRHQAQGQPGSLSSSAAQRAEQQTWIGGGKEPRHPDDVEADDGTFGTMHAAAPTWEGGGSEPRHPDDVEADDTDEDET